MKPFTALCTATLLFLAATTGAAAKDISATEAHEAIKNGKLTLIDIRTPQEWKQTGVVPGANLINMLHPQGAPGFMSEVLEKVGGDKTAPIGLICRTGNRTTQVQRFLEAQGFTQIYNIKEGMVGSGAGPGWLARKLPVESCQRC